MAELRSRFVLSVCLLAITALPAGAILPTDDTSVFEVPLETPAIIQSPVNVPGVAEITGQLNSRLGGDWHVHLWNPDSNTPHAITGTGIKLSGSVADDAGAANAALGFVTQHADLLRVSPADLEVDRVIRGMDKVAVHFEQRFHGVPVQGGRVMTFFDESGRLSIFGSAFYGGINVNPVPAVGAAAAAAIATRDLPFNPATDRVLVEPELLVLPKHREGQSPEYHLVWRTTVGTAEPYGAWVTYIDAHDSEIVARVNDVHGAYSGTSQGDVDQTGYCDGQQTSPFRNQTINVSGIGSQLTNASGQFNFAGTGGNRTLTAIFDGPIVFVNDTQFVDAAISTTIQENVPLTINWTDVTPSRRTERDVFYYVNATNVFIKGIDPAWSIGKHTANVNVNSTCNANWSPALIMNFFREGGGCANTGTIGDVVAHEYGHGIQFSLLGSQGNEGLGEGNADISGSFIADDFVIGRGFNLNQCSAGLRSCLNSLQYPQDVVGQQIHNAGRVICGFNWDLRVLLENKMGQAAGEAHTAMLWHFGRKLFVPFFQPDQVLAYFGMDDDDANLGNGSPNSDEICEAAENHGFDCPPITEGVNITHTPLVDTVALGPYAVNADIAAFGPHPLDTSTTELHYSFNGGAYTTILMTNVGGNTYQGTIPAVATGTAVAYWISAETVVGTPGFFPPNAPEDYVLFGAGTFNTNLTDDIETDQGWTVTENATDGTWERANPNGTFAGSIPVNPEDDHTANPGVICWVTGNPPAGSIFFIEELDGSTSIRSPNIDMSNCNLARGSVFLWLYSNSAEDVIDVDASSDGGNTWVTVRRVSGSELNAWNQYNFTLSPFDIDFTSQMRIRVRGQDIAPDTIVDCGMDDFIIRSLPSDGPLAVDPPQASVPVSYALLPSQPNPFNPSTEIRYELPRDEQVKLTVFDVTGRELQVLVDESKEAGSHAVSWNGTDREGRAMPSGVYFYRLEAGSYKQTHRMTLLK